MSTINQYHADLMRLWRTTDGEWRASLDDPHTGERRCFTTLERCLDYLIRVTQPGLTATEAANLAAAEDAGEA